MNWKEFEANMKSEVQQHASEIDVEALWEKVAPKKRKRYPILMFVLPLLFILVGTFLYFEHDLFRWSEIPQLHPEISKPISLSKNISPKHTNKAGLSENDNLRTDEILTVAAVQHKSSNANEPSRVSRQEHRTTRQKDQKSTSTFANTGNQLVSQLVPLQIETAHPSTTAAASIEPSIADASVVEPMLHIEQRDLVQAVSPLALTNSNPLNITRNEYNMPMAETSIKPKYSKRYSILVQAGIGGWSPKLLPKQQESNAYLARKSSEIALESRQVQILFQGNTCFFKNIKTGVQYTEYHSRMNMNQRWTEQKPIGNDLISINYYVNGTADSLIGTSLSTITYERTTVHFNTIRTIRIPIYYQPIIWTATRDLSVSPSVGILFDVFQQSRGVIVNGQSSIQPLEEISNLHPGFGVSLDLSVNLRYSVSNQGALLLTPYFGSYLTDLYQKSYNLSSKVQNYGFRVGYQQSF